MRHFLRARRFTVVPFALTVALLLAGGGVRSAWAQDEGEDHGEDLLLRYNEGTGLFSVEPKSPGAVIFTRAMDRFGSTYINDTGFDVYPSIDAVYLDDNGNDIRNISQATLTQVGISPGLTAVYAFDSVTPVFGQTTNPANSQTGFKWVQAESKPPAQSQAVHSDTDDPYYLHQHFTFSSSGPGTYYFDFQYTNIHTFTRDAGGQEVEGLTNGTSPVYRITYTAAAAGAPEPGTVALLGTALPLLAGAVVVRRKRRA